MIADREGDLAVTEDGHLMLDVGGFLMELTKEEMHARSDQVYELMIRRARRVQKRALRTEIPLGTVAEVLELGEQPLVRVKLGGIDRVRFFKVTSQEYDAPPGTLHLLDLTEPPQPDCYAGQ